MMNHWFEWGSFGRSCGDTDEHHVSDGEERNRPHLYVEEQVEQYC